MLNMGLSIWSFNQSIHSFADAAEMVTNHGNQMITKMDRQAVPEYTVTATLHYQLLSRLFDDYSPI